MLHVDAFDLLQLAHAGVKHLLLLLLPFLLNSVQLFVFSLDLNRPRFLPVIDFLRLLHDLVAQRRLRVHLAQLVHQQLLILLLLERYQLLVVVLGRVVIGPNHFVLELHLLLHFFAVGFHLVEDFLILF